MATLTVTVPESAAVPAGAVIAGAARRAGYTPEHEGTAEEFLAAHFAAELSQLYRSARVDEVLAEAQEALPAPERPQRRLSADGGDAVPPPERTP